MDMSFVLWKFVVFLLGTLVVEGIFPFAYNTLPIPRPYKVAFWFPNVPAVILVPLFYYWSRGVETINFSSFLGIFTAIILTMVVCGFCWNKEGGYVIHFGRR